MPYVRKSSLPQGDNLYNDGEIGVYQFNNTDSQIYVQVTPVVPTALAAAAVQFTQRRTPRKVRSERV